MKKRLFFIAAVIIAIPLLLITIKYVQQKYYLTTDEGIAMEQTAYKCAKAYLSFDNESFIPLFGKNEDGEYYFVNISGYQDDIFDSLEYLEFSYPLDFKNWLLDYNKRNYRDIELKDRNYAEVYYKFKKKGDDQEWRFYIYLALNDSEWEIQYVGDDYWN